MSPRKKRFSKGSDGLRSSLLFIAIKNSSSISNNLRNMDPIYDQLQETMAAIVEYRRNQYENEELLEPIYETIRGLMPEDYRQLEFTFPNNQEILITHIHYQMTKVIKMAKAVATNTEESLPNRTNSRNIFVYFRGIFRSQLYHFLSSLDLDDIEEVGHFVSPATSESSSDSSSDSCLESSDF